MSYNPFGTSPKDLPAQLPIFPLAGALLLPRTRLPLNVFEPRYLALVAEALGAGRLFGMVQPKGSVQTTAATDDAVPELYSVGCMGRVTSFGETADGRLLLALTGVCRFKITEVLQAPQGFLRARVNWHDYLLDCTEQEEAVTDFDRKQLAAALRPYFKAHGIMANWEMIDESSPEKLVNSLAGVLPFLPSEKQALLEAPTLETRRNLLLQLLAMGAQEAAGDEGARH